MLSLFGSAQKNQGPGFHDENPNLDRASCHSVSYITLWILPTMSRGRWTPPHLAS